MDELIDPIDPKKEIEAIKALPPDIQSALMSVEMSKALQEIGSKHKLHLDTLDDLFEVTVDVLMGNVHPDDYVLELEEKLNLSEEAANLLAADVNAQIFTPVQDSLKTLYKQDDAAEEGGFVLDATKQQEGAAFAAEITPPKEDVLKEIEEPQATQSAVFTQPKPALQQPSTPAVPQTETAHTTPPSILETKLGSTTSAPPKKYVSDPYRIPIDPNDNKK